MEELPDELKRRPYEMAHQWVKRLAKEGLSVEEIVKITGYDERFVRMHASRVTRGARKRKKDKAAYIPIFMKVNPIIGAMYNLLRQRGYDGSFSDFIHECVFMALGMHPELSIEADPEILELKKKMRLKELKNMVKKKYNVDAEIDKILKYYQYIELLEELM